MILDDSVDLKSVKESITRYLSNVDRYSIRKMEVKNITSREKSYFRLFVDRSIDKEFNAKGTREFIEQCDRLQHFRDQHESYVMARKEYYEAKEKDYISYRRYGGVYLNTDYSDPYYDKYINESDRIDELFPEEMLPDTQGAVSYLADLDYLTKEFESAYVSLLRRRKNIGIDELYRESREQMRLQIIKHFYDQNKEKIEPKFNH